MLSKKIKQILMILIVSAFVSNSFAAWGYHRGHTACRGGACHHTTVKKGCHNGHCHTLRRGTTWHR